MLRVWAVWSRYENSSALNPVLCFKYFEMARNWIERQSDPVAWIAQEVQAVFTLLPPLHQGGAEVSIRDNFGND
jgi:hypothetical protein